MSNILTRLERPCEIILTMWNIIGYSSDDTSSTSVTNPMLVDTWIAEQKAAYKKAFGMVMEGADKPVAKAPFDMYAGVNPAEQNYFSGVQGGAAERQAALSSILGGKSSYNANPQVMDDYYNQAIRDPALREYNTITKQAIGEQFAGPGYWGSARATAGANAAENLATTLAAKRAELNYSELNKSRDLQEAALGRQAQFGANAAATISGIEGQAGQYARQIENEKIASNLLRWTSGEAMQDEKGNWVTPTQNNPFLQALLNLVGAGQQNAVASQTVSSSKGSASSAGIG